MKNYAAYSVCILSFLSVCPVQADVSPGLLSDFESGTLEDWDGGSTPTNIPTGGPAGVGDNYLQISGGNNFATFNASLSGVLDPSITSIDVDLLRPAGESDLEMRLVLFGPSTFDRWTSTNFQVVPGDGTWSTYSFSVLESDLTRVAGGSSYTDLTTNLDRIMFRYDPGPPDFGGTPSPPGSLGLDNITALPLPVIPGDANCDGKVDLLDLDILGQFFGQVVLPGDTKQGDFNGDGNVDLLDLDILGGNFGFGTSASVPEPSATLLLATGLVCLKRRL